MVMASELHQLSYVHHNCKRVLSTQKEYTTARHIMTCRPNASSRIDYALSVMLIYLFDVLCIEIYIPIGRSAQFPV
jgi:hypothetical protein